MAFPQPPSRFIEDCLYLLPVYWNPRKFYFQGYLLALHTVLVSWSFDSSHVYCVSPVCPALSYTCLSWMWSMMMAMTIAVHCWLLPSWLDGTSTCLLNQHKPNPIPPSRYSLCTMPLPRCPFQFSFSFPLHQVALRYVCLYCHKCIHTNMRTRTYVRTCVTPEIRALPRREHPWRATNGALISGACRPSCWTRHVQ